MRIKRLISHPLSWCGQTRSPLTDTGIALLRVTPNYHLLCHMSIYQLGWKFENLDTCIRDKCV